MVSSNWGAVQGWGFSFTNVIYCTTIKTTLIMYNIKLCVFIVISHRLFSRAPPGLNRSDLALVLVPGKTHCIQLRQAR